ncbi:mCG21757, isoform CRA_a [Mus musculus]|nr:mCG21757, isoform CRA_a [Mus musculus]EDL13667.1 mCG21757, isoform CRA_a [Mus musculus]
MKCQTWLKNLKRLRRTWKPRRSPLVPDACLALQSGPTSSILGGLSPSQPRPKLCSSLVSDPARC